MKRQWGDTLDCRQVKGRTRGVPALQLIRALIHDALIHHDEINRKMVRIVTSPDRRIMLQPAHFLVQLRTILMHTKPHLVTFPVYSFENKDFLELAQGLLQNTHAPRTAGH